MKRRQSMAVAVLLLTLAAGVGTIWLFARPSTTAIDPTGASPQWRDAATPDSLAVPVSPGAASTPAASHERVEIEGAAPVADDDAEKADITVLVVDRVTQQPVAGAEVFVGLPRNHPKTARARSDRASAADLPELIGTLWHTGDDGQVMVPRPRDGVAVAARHDQRFGIAGLNPNTRSPLPIELARDTSLRVLVVDGAGTPRGGVPLSLRMRFPGRDAPATKHLGETRADGTFSCRHFAYFVETVERQEGGTPEFAEVIVRGVGIDAAGIALDLHHPPPDPLLLQLPAHGAVRVRVVDVTGDPLGHQAKVQLESLPLPESNIERVRARATAVLQPRQEEHVFARVGLGATLRASVHVSTGIRYHPGDPTLPVTITETGADRRIEVPPKEGPGPSHHGEVVTFTFVIGAAASKLTGQVRRDGAPLRDGRLACRLRAGTTEMTIELNTDSDGEFTILAPPSFVGHVLDVVELELREGKRTLTAISRPDIALVAGERHDLGELVLDDAPLIVAGIVVDESGAPIDGAQIHVQHRSQLSDESMAGGWIRKSLRMHVVRSGAGRFAIHGNLPVEPCVLTVWHDGYMRGASTPFTNGDDDLRLVLSRGSLLDASFAAPTELRRQPVRGWLQCPDGALHGLGWTVDDGRIRLRSSWIPPGTYDLTVRLIGDRVPLLDVRGVNLVAGETCTDPRVQQTDVRDHVRFLRVQVMAPGGEMAPSDTVIELHDTLDPQWTWSQVGRDVRLPFTGEPRDVSVRAAGFMPQRLSLSEDTVVRLEAEAKVVR